MKILLSSQTCSRPGGRHEAMTLIEMMFAVGISSIVILGILSSNFLGLREDQLMESKAGANDSSRQMIGKMIYDIKSAKGYDIGNGNAANFFVITNSFFQGNALRLYTSILAATEAVSLTNYTYYYFDSSAGSQDGVLWRATTRTTPTVVASNLIGSLVFTSENYTGAVQSVRTYKGVVHTTLQFCEFQYPLTAIGSNGLYNYYRIDCRATPHLPDGP